MGEGRARAPPHTRTSLCDLLCDCPTGKSLKPVQPSREKYSASRSPQITPTTPAIPRPQEGRIAIITDVGCGERWPRHAGRATSLRRVSLLMSEGRAPTNGANFPLSPEFDGQVPGPANPPDEDGSRTAKPCGPGARCWRQAGGGFVNPTGFAKAFNPPATEAKGIRLRGELGISRTPIAQGMPSCSGCTCMLVCVSFAHVAH